MRLVSKATSDSNVGKSLRTPFTNERKLCNGSIELSPIGKTSGTSSSPGALPYLKSLALGSSYNKHQLCIFQRLYH